MHSIPHITQSAQTLHFITLHYITLHYITMVFCNLHCIDGYEHEAIQNPISENNIGAFGAPKSEITKAACVTKLCSQNHHTKRSLPPEAT